MNRYLFLLIIGFILLIPINIKAAPSLLLPDTEIETQQNDTLLSINNTSVNDTMSNEITDNAIDEIPDDDHDCDETDYDLYTKCIKAKVLAARSKRQSNEKHQIFEINAIDSIQINCEKLKQDCLDNCGLDNQTCSHECPVCPTTAEFVIEAPEDAPIIAPEASKGYRTVIIKGENGTQDQYYEAQIEAGQNVTTIIRLTNIINNTNTFNVPTNISSSNINHIHIYANKTKSTETGGKFGLGYNEKGDCCFAVQPKSCSQSSNGMRCHHKRNKICGPECTSRIIHVQSRKKCNKSTGECDSKVAYVPEPSKKATCVYIDHWPFVSCGGNNENQNSCHGCYDHYGYGYENYHKNQNDDEGKPDCRGCYEDAFDMGPLYRRGPVLRPYYYHQVPCYITGTCIPYIDCSYGGCFGGEFMDPAWGFARHHRKHHQNEEFEYDDDEEIEDDHYKHHKTNNESRTHNKSSDIDNNEGSGDWGVQIHKCSVVSDDGTIEIRNCTSADIDENPYAAAPSDYPYQSQEEDDLDEIIRRRRHSHQPIVKTHYRRSRKSEKYHRKSPIIEDSYYYDDDDDNSYVEDDDDFYVPVAHKKRRNLRKSRKHPKIVYDEDSEENDVSY